MATEIEVVAEVTEAATVYVSNIGDKNSSTATADQQQSLLQLQLQLLVATASVTATVTSQTVKTVNNSNRWQNTQWGGIGGNSNCCAPMRTGKCRHCPDQQWCPQ